jgi:hypothetical protein
LVKNFIGNPNVDAARIVESEVNGDDYIIPVHDVARAAILGDNAYYHPPASMASNLFDVSDADQKEHFLAPLALSYMLAEAAPRDAEGFVSTAATSAELQGFGFIDRQVTQCLRRLARAALIEASERARSLDQGSFGAADLTIYHCILDRLISVPITLTDGWRLLYTLTPWCLTRRFLILYLFNELCGTAENFYLSVRYNRAAKFRDYLTAVWNRFQHRPTYFDWNECLAQQGESFMIVQRYLERQHGPATKLETERTQVVTRLLR